MSFTHHRDSLGAICLQMQTEDRIEMQCMTYHFSGALYTLVPLTVVIIFSLSLFIGASKAIPHINF